MKMFLSLWCSAFLWFSSAVFGAHAKERLLNYSSRPTMTDFVRELDPMPATNPFKSLIIDPYLARLDFMVRFIVELEFAYPGSTWALLGRDSSLSADVLEAFYMGEGQTHRIVRLNASGQSFGDGMQFQRAFLFTAGLVDQLGTPLKKFIILDSTSWANTSQTKRLLRSIYQSMSSTNQTCYLPFVNVVNIADQAYDGVGRRTSSSLDFLKFWSELKMSDNAPQEIAHIQGLTYLPSGTFGEIVWHDKFGYFQYTISDGTVKAPMGVQSCPQNKEHVLWWMYEVYKKVSSRTFRNSVVDLAKTQYGYDFDKRLQQHRSSLIPAVETWIEEFQDVHDPKKVEYFTTVLSHFSKGLTKQLANFAEGSLITETIIRKYGGNSPLLDFFPSARPLLRSETATEFILRVKKLDKNRKSYSLRNALDHFYSLNPTIDQINELISLVKRNGTTHQLIAGKALAAINNLIDYKKLKRPWRIFRNDNYKDLRTKFKNAHPGFFQKRPYFSFPIKAY